MRVDFEQHYVGHLIDSLPNIFIKKKVKKIEVNEVYRHLSSLSLLFFHVQQVWCVFATCRWQQESSFSACLSLSLSSKMFNWNNWSMIWISNTKKNFFLLPHKIVCWKFFGFSLDKHTLMLKRRKKTITWEIHWTRKLKDIRQDKE